MARKKGHSPDYIVIFCIFFLVLAGLFVLSSASSELGQLRFDDSYYYLKRQILFGLLVGLVGFFLASKIYYGRYKNPYFSTVLLIGTIFLLLAVFSPLGLEIKGATRWLAIGDFSFQPAEILKLTLIIYLAIWLSGGKHRQHTLKQGYIPFLIILSLVGAILLAQRSTAPAAILLVVASIMYFISGAKWRYVGATLAIGVVLVGIIISFSPYRTDRIFSYLEPEADPLGSGFHAIQAKTAIGSGGWTGVGYGRSIMKSTLPEPIGDSIFAIIAEEFGFIGSLALMGFFVFLILRIFLLAKRTRDQFGQLLLVGFGTIIGVQALFNFGAMIGFFPLTGTPLPFISFGGTALAVFMTMGGIITNVSRYS
ncbi:MAG: putative peptidoglycan glycosyltransferase FtsW [Candidatus Harrisonbacteria bacterium]|nr:putative peptidoglycan glycosyltransferase FtsW [Candidatus Harrisonbacteria bacterium]